MNNTVLYKSLIRSEVIAFIILLYFPLLLFTLSFDVLLSALILGFRHQHEFADIFRCQWWKLLSVTAIQFFVLCFLYGLFIGLKRVIIRNRDFFLS